MRARCYIGASQDDESEKTYPSGGATPWVERPTGYLGGRRGRKQGQADLVALQVPCSELPGAWKVPDIELPFTDPV